MLTLLVAVLGTVGLFAPGLAWGRALRVGWPLIAAVGLGPIALVVALVALDLAGAPLRPWTLGLAVGLAAAVAWPARRLLDRLDPSGAVVGPGAGAVEPGGAAVDSSCRAWPAWGLAAPLVLTALLALRCALQPLAGVDVAFRWGWLAERIAVDGTLAFYPPRSAEEFRTYFWPDGIPPLVSGTYAWLWAWTGPAPRTTTLLVVAQWVAALALVGRLATRLGSPRAGALAVGLVALCPLAWRAVAIGQETGWTTVALLGATWAIVDARRPGDPRAMALAGAFAALGGLAREYGLAFVGCAALLAWIRGHGRAGVATLVGVAAALLAPWYLRTWARTGNPLFDHALGPFPVLPVYAGHRAARLAEQAWTARGAEVAALSALRDAAGPLVLGGLGLAIAPAARVVALPAALVVGLWVWSVPHTDAGVFYSLRVLAPACALLAVAAGLLLDRVLARPAAPAPAQGAPASPGPASPGPASPRAVVAQLLAVWAVTIGAIPLAVWAVSSAAAHPLLPGLVRPGTWPRLQVVARPILAAPAEALEAELLAALPPGSVALGTDPYAFALLHRRGRTLLAPWSPETAFLCDPALDDRARLARLRGLGVVATVCGEEDEVRFARRWSGWAHVTRLPVALRARGIVVRRVE